VGDARIDAVRPARDLRRHVAGVVDDIDVVPSSPFMSSAPDP
jgi:hypothetical protein